MTRKEAEKKFGKIENNKWINESLWMVIAHVPREISDCCINSASGRSLKIIYCNKVIKQILLDALDNVVTRGLASQLKTFDGCFNIRNARGSNSLSAHSYGIAIDINAATNKLNTEGDITDELAKCFTDAGFTWGKTFSRKDPMHFSLGF